MIFVLSALGHAKCKLYLEQSGFGVWNDTRMVLIGQERTRMCGFGTVVNIVLLRFVAAQMVNLTSRPFSF